MALQSSGQISMADVYQELTGGAPGANQNYTLSDLCDGTVATINTAGPNQPTTVAPYRLTSWYGYDHNYSAGVAPKPSFTLVFNGTLGRTDKVITLTDTSIGGTDRGWQITGGSYTIIGGGNLGTYATGLGGNSVIKVTFNDPNKTYTVNLRAYNTNGTSTATDTQFITAYLLEKYPTAVKQVFSLRKLNADVTNAIRVRRDSDNIEQDIGFDNDGVLDTSAIQTFVGKTANGYITRWYDQSGNMWNVTESVETNQPRIIASNVIDVDSSGNVAVRFLSGSNTRMKGSTSATTMGLSGSQNRTDYLVACETTQSYLGTTINIAGTVPTAYANGAFWRITHETANRVYGGNRAWENAGTNLANSSVQLGVVKLDGTSTSNMTHYQNGSNTASNVTATGAVTINIGTAYTFFGNDYIGTSYLNGYVAEYIVYATAHDDTTRGLIEDDILAYYAGI